MKKKLICKKRSGKIWNNIIRIKKHWINQKENINMKKADLQEIMMT